MQNDPVTRPKHYQSPYGVILRGREYFIEALDVIKCWGLQNDFYLGNVVKYILRAGKKDDNAYLQDLMKARYYLDARIKELAMDIAAKEGEEIRTAYTAEEMAKSSVSEPPRQA